jgi:hypothetical protein
VGVFVGVEVGVGSEVLVSVGVAVFVGTGVSIAVGEEVTLIGSVVFGGIVDWISGVADDIGMQSASDEMRNRAANARRVFIRKDDFLDSISIRA